MFNNITYYLIFGKPLIMWGGIVLLVLLLFTASIPTLNRKKITHIPIVWHYRMAYLTIAVGLIHAIFGILSFF